MFIAVNANGKFDSVGVASSYLPRFYKDVIPSGFPFGYKKLDKTSEDSEAIGTIRRLSANIPT